MVGINFDIKSTEKQCRNMNELQKAVEYLEEEGKKVQSKLKDAISAIGQTAQRVGLDVDMLDSLMRFVVGDIGNGSVLNRCQVLRTLIPQTTVSLSTILTALGAMGCQPLSLKKLLFQWIVLVYDLISDREPTFHSLYDVILYYVQYDELRSIVCQLLCYLTRREDVKEYRVQRLTELQRNVLVSKEVSESGLVALLSVYRRYCPHLTRLSFTTRRKNWFKPFEKKLASSILKVQGQRSTQTSLLPEPLICTASTVNSQLESLPPPPKRSKTAPTIPTLHSSHPHNSHSNGDNPRVSVVQLTSIQELCDNIHRLELPSQMAAVLESNLLRYVLCLNSDPSTVTRLTYWLQHFLGYELDSYVPGGPESDNLLHMLSCLKDLTEFILEPIPVVESFLSILLEVWNGVDYQSEVLGLLEHLSLQAFSDLEQDYLDPLKSHFEEKDLNFRQLVLSTLTSLFTNLVTLEWPRHKKRTEATGNDSTIAKKLSLFHDISTTLEDDEDDDMIFDPKDTLRRFVGYMENMVTFALREDYSHPLIQHSAASFYEIVTKLPEVYGIPLLCVPRPHIVFNVLLSPDVAALDRLLTSFLNCKSALTAVNKSDRGVESTHVFNSIVLDLCDALWRNYAFKNSQRKDYPTLLFKMSQEHLFSCGLPSASDKLNVVHHPALLGFVKKFYKATQSPTDDLQPSAIWREGRFKESYLDYLQQNNLIGTVSFIRQFIRYS